MKHTVRFTLRSLGRSILWAAALGLTLTGAGCTATAVRLDETISGPQLAADPAALSLGVATLLKTNLRFIGKGFAPREKVMLVLIGSDAVTREVMVPLGFGAADDQGRFAIEMEKPMKISNLLNADVVFGEKGPIVMISGLPVPAGAYSAKATGYTSDLTAACPLTLTAPSFMDRLKDRIARMMGKVALE